MSAAVPRVSPSSPHVPVLLRPILERVAPVTGVWLDGTFGAGGYTRGLLQAGAARVIAMDRDPAVFRMTSDWRGGYGDRLRLIEGNFDQMDRYARDLDGVILDLGVSSMQLDQAARGFSFLRDGPLDMRMSGSGPCAADLVNRASETMLADILFFYGEERAARRIARTIVKARPLVRTVELAEVIAHCLPRTKPGQSHPATRSFQALRIAVNDELGALVRGLFAASRILKPDGILAVVSFHSIEDRIVKRFLRLASGGAGRPSRHAPERAEAASAFTLMNRKAIEADASEVAANPRARSARLRMARRMEAPLPDLDPGALGAPVLTVEV